MTPTRRLFRLFLDRLFNNDTVSDGSFETNIYQILGLLAAPGYFIAMLFLPAFLKLSTSPHGPAADWVLRTQRLLFPAYSFAVTAFAVFFEWDMLFPDRRDFLVLAPFPIRLRTLFAAKFGALGFFVGLLISAINFFPTLAMPLFSLFVPEARRSGLMVQMMAAQLAATGGASALAFFAVATLQGALINISNPRIFQRISPWVQMIGMSTAILAIFLFPVYSLLLPSMVTMHPQWLRFLPPVWFTGVYDLWLPHPNPVFESLGAMAGKALMVVAGLFCVTWLMGFRRHYRRTLEAQNTESRAPRPFRLERLFGPPVERAIYRFGVAIAARSAKHRLFLATYWSVGIAVGLATTIVVRVGRLGISQEGLRSLPLLVMFFVVSGFRAAFQFPAELSSNWLFRMAEGEWAEVSRRAARKHVWIRGLIPALILFFPLEASFWGAGAAMLHTMFQLLTGGLLVEVLFWNFNKVPFTCSYFPGTMSLALLACLYLYGFTTYSFEMADLEAAFDLHPLQFALFGAGAVPILALLWRRRVAASPVRFEGHDPEIQPLDLT